MNRWFDKIPFLKGKVSGKISLSFTLLLFAAVLLLINNQAHRIWCFGGMMFSFVGDVSLNHRNNGKQTTSDFIVGAISFMVAHIFYGVAYICQISIHQMYFFNGGAIAALVLMLFTIVGVLIAIMDTNSTASGKIIVTSLIYIVIISFDCMCIFSYAVSTNYYLALIGAISFFISDCMVGSEKLFKVKSKLIRELIWWFYPIGQILIIIFA